MAVAAFLQPDTTVLADAEYVDVVITNGTSLSAAVDLGNRTPVGLLVPATWTAAGISFQGSPDGTTYGKLVDSTGTEVTAASLAGGEYVALDPSKFFGVRFLKVRSGTNGTPVSQGGDRTVRLVGRGM